MDNPSLDFFPLPRKHSSHNKTWSMINLISSIEVLVCAYFHISSSEGLSVESLTTFPNGQQLPGSNPSILLTLSGHSKTSLLILPWEDYLFFLLFVMLTVPCRVVFPAPGGSAFLAVFYWIANSFLSLFELWFVSLWTPHLELPISLGLLLGSNNEKQLSTLGIGIKILVSSSWVKACHTHPDQPSPYVVLQLYFCFKVQFLYWQVLLGFFFPAVLPLHNLYQI